MVQSSDGCPGFYVKSFGAVLSWKARATVLRPPHALDECSTGFRDIFDEMAICKRPNESHCICGIAPEQTGTICVEIAREMHSLGV